MEPEPQARTKFITPGQLIEGTIVEVSVNQDPFHCTIRILPKDGTLINAEGRYSDHEISLGKLKRNLVHLRFSIRDLEDIIAAVESLEGRECIFRVDKSGWVSWIPRLTGPSLEAVAATPIPAPVLAKLQEREIVEVFFMREPGHKSIYRMENQHGGVLGWAVGPTGRATTKPRGWVLNLATKEEAYQVLEDRKIPLTKQ